MKIENLQIPKGYSKAKNSNSSEPQEDFSKMLSCAMTAGKSSGVGCDNKANGTADPNVEVAEVEEDNSELINPLLQFLNMTLYSDEIIDTSVLGETQIEDLGMEALKAINFIDTDIIQVENMNITDGDIPYVDFKASLINEQFILEDNLIRPELLGEAEILPLKDILQQDSTTIDAAIASHLTDNISKSQPKDKNFSLEDDYIPVNEVKALKVEELIQKDTNNIVSPLEDETLDIENDATVDGNKWSNHNIEGAKGLTVTNDTTLQPKVLSNENIQNVNDSIIHLMETTTEGNTNVMKVQLYPEELGAVNITLKMEDGKLIAKILVDDDYVKQLFIGKIEQLSNNLIKQNVNMDQISVELNANSNSNPNGDSQQKGGNFSSGNKSLNFESESLEQNTTEEIKSDLGALSILA